MDYHQIQKLRRDVEAGLYTAPQPFPIVDVSKFKSKKRKRKVEINENRETQDEWCEEGFIDDFYGDMDDTAEDVTPDYFSACDQLITEYFCDENIDESVTTMPLFKGSKYSGKDLARFLLSFKARYLAIGDGILANIVAIMATFLPEENTLKAHLPDKTSTYLLLKTLDNLAHFKTSLRCLKIDCCVGKCMGFYGYNSHLNFCSVCDQCRWRLCTQDCFDENEEKICDHTLIPYGALYYNVVQDRLVKLLKSDLKNLFNYEFHRAGEEYIVCLEISRNVSKYLEMSRIVCILHVSNYLEMSRIVYILYVSNCLELS